MPVQPVPCTGIFNCPLPSCPNGSLSPTNVKIEYSSILAKITKVTLWCATNELDNIGPVASGILATLTPSIPSGSPLQGYNLQVTVEFGAGPGSMCTIQSLGLQFT